AFLGFYLGGALRLAVEPPLHADADHDPTALAEEAELGAMFVRQQFRGAQIARVTVLGLPRSIDEMESALQQRLGVPVQRLAVRDLSTPAMAGIGAVLDALSARPLALAGPSRQKSVGRTAPSLRTWSIAAVVLTFLAG